VWERNKTSQTSLPPKLRQLGDIADDPSRLILAEQPWLPSVGPVVFE
jgi:hypothetical protein